MSVIVIVLIAVGAILLLFFIGGLFYTVRRYQRLGRDFYRHLAAADQALEQARAEDKGWDRAALEAAARAGLAAERPGWAYDNLHLVLVDDRPGVMEDRAEFLAVGAEGMVRVGLVRNESGWAHDRVE
jgi:hypothetical protein